MVSKNTAHTKQKNSPILNPPSKSDTTFFQSSLGTSRRFLVIDTKNTSKEEEDKKRKRRKKLFSEEESHVRETLPLRWRRKSAGDGRTAAV